MHSRPAVSSVAGVKASPTLASAQSRINAKAKMTAAMVANISEPSLPDRWAGAAVTDARNLTERARSS